MLGRYCLPVGVVNTWPTVRSLIFSLGRSGRFCRRRVDLDRLPDPDSSSSSSRSLLKNGGLWEA